MELAFILIVISVAIVIRRFGRSNTIVVEDRRYRYGSAHGMRFTAEVSDRKDTPPGLG